MGKTSVSKRGINEERLTDKQRRFVHEYLIDYNGTRAATEAGYKNPQVIASKLLNNNSLVKKAIGKAQSDLLDTLGLTREEALKQLFYCLTRSAKDFCDKDGNLITNVN